MVLRLADRWVWDFWLAEDGDAVHAFYLQAPRALGDPTRRHRHATIGHAVSTDLRTWEPLPDPLAPARPGAWDDLATWTGSVVRAGGSWAMLYTGLSSRDGGLVQRIGLAVSTDLIRWQRVGDRPVLEADATWYERLDSEAGWPHEAWRDPWVVPDPAGDGYHALITARARSGPLAERGVIGHARSADLVEWEVRPPLPSPAGFAQIEVPQVVPDGGSALLVFSAGAADVGPARLRRHGPTPGGTYVCRGPSLLGPFDVPIDVALAPVTSLYAGKLVRRGGRWLLLGFVDVVDGRFVGEMADPQPFDPGGAEAVASAAGG
ncbi:MAG TPA: hypothetical protein VNJ28_00500 [Candidatus Limnocylindrales bacterium]|nr:hypothetical protein [Candidatus Limnocylindrales bacterium]